MKKKKLLLLTVLAIALGASISLAFLLQGPRGPMSEERAMDIIKAHVAEAEENVRIDRIELRPPTGYEAYFLRNSYVSKEPPELMWFADVTRFHGPVSVVLMPENRLIDNIMVGDFGMIWLDAYTGEVVLGSFLD